MVAKIVWNKMWIHRTKEHVLPCDQTIDVWSLSYKIEWQFYEGYSKNNIWSTLTLNLDVEHYILIFTRRCTTFKTHRDRYQTTEPQQSTSSNSFRGGKSCLLWFICKNVIISEKFLCCLYSCFLLIIYEEFHIFYANLPGAVLEKSITDIIIVTVKTQKKKLLLLWFL